MTRNGGRRTLQDRRLAELPNSKLTAEARDPNQNTTFSTESVVYCLLPPATPGMRSLADCKRIVLPSGRSRMEGR